MSSMLANASQLKPEIRLAQAVSQFEADLSSEQKTTFRTYRSQLRDSPPDLSDVMRLTAEIDRRASGKVGGRRCIGPRLTNFLQAVQQFAALGDIVVGSSQNIVACGVWSLMRMSLLSIVNFSAYLEKLSTLFMTVGRSAPRYQMMALLYSHSKNLQSHLSEYFIVVVRLCHQLLKFTQKSTLAQFVSTLNDFDTKTYQSELDHWADTIKEEANLLLAQKIDQEAQENSRFRALSSDFSKLVLHQRKMKTNLRVLDLCSMYDYKMTWKQTRKIGNTTLFNQSAKYQDWKGQADSCTLIYTGKLGSGKSVLLANIVDDINLNVDSKKLVVAYFFCRHDLPESLKARTIFGSLARQLLSPITDLATVTRFLDTAASTLDLDGILNLLRRALPPSYRAYFILDGVDECDDNEKNQLIHLLRMLQDRFILVLCISMRLDPGNTLTLTLEQLKATTITSIPDENPDIEIFITVELETCIESKELRIGDPTLILEIQDALLEGSKGMFLWVALQIKSLCGMKTDTAIRQALADLPKDLSETFSRILQRSEASGKPYQRPILELITVAHRLLTIEELREALSVVPGDTVWDPARLLNDIFSTLTCCGSLLVVDEEELTVRLVHHSVKQFLLSEFKDSNNKAFAVDDGKRRMADIIVTYLNYGVFQTQLSTIVIPQIKIGSAPSKIIHSTLDSSSSVRVLALKLLKSRRHPNYDISKTLVETNKLFKPRSVNEFHFVTYAKSHWPQHILDITEQESAIYSLLLRLIENKVVDISTTDEDGLKLLQWAACNGHEAVVKLLLDSSQVDIDSNSGNGHTPLSLAAMNGHAAVVKLLLDSNQVDINSNSSNRQTPLSWAAMNGHAAVVKLLLNSNQVDINSNSSNRQTPLSWAAMNGHAAVVKLLLDSNQVYIDSKGGNGQTPLSLAAMNGHAAVVKLLLNSNQVDVNSTDVDGKTPLLWASKNGYGAIVKLLLDSEIADIDLKDLLGKTALSWAAKSGHGTIVKLLLDSGEVDINSKDNISQIPLSLAATNGHEAIVKLLLDSSEVDVNSEDCNLQTSLSLAAEYGYEAVVKLLLDSNKVDFGLRDKWGRSPLSWAAMHGHEAVVKLLIGSNKFSADIENVDGRTPLSWAALNGHEAVVKLLQL